MAIRPAPGMAGAEMPVHRRVRVWFGEHAIADYVATVELASRYEAAMRRRFMGLRVTNEPLHGGEAEPPPLPSERLWELPPS